MQIRALHSPEEFARYGQFGHEVYRQHPCWVEEGSQILATLTAVIHERYNHHWQEQMGHFLLFEALPDHDAAIEALAQAACGWLRHEGCDAARASLLYAWQTPWTIDAYDVVPTVFHTYNPAYYHRYIKNAGFVTEHGLVEYRTAFTLGLAQRYQAMVDQVSGAGVSLRSWNLDRLSEEIALFTMLYNETFSAHWAVPPFTFEEMHGWMTALQDVLVTDFPGFAEVNGHAVGFVFSLPDLNQVWHQMRQHNLASDPAALQHLAQAIDHGVLLIIGVQRRYRGRGINLALAAKS